MKKLLFLSSIILLMSSGIIPQQQSWILQNLQASMSGIHLYKAGDDCIVHTQASSQYIYFFDINNKNWIEYDLGSQQNMIAVEVGKQVAFAYSDSLLIGFSSNSSICKTINYSGNVISPNGTVSGTRGYGCGDNGAYVFTDQNIMYVFDALIGEWKSYQFSEVLNATGASNFWCGDKYAAGIFHRFYPEKNRQIVYSLITGTFNQTDMGGVYYTSAGIAMTGGFVSSYSGEPDSVLLTGYSAFTNQFYPLQENPPYSQLTLGSMDDSWIDCNKRNIYGYAITRGDVQSCDLKINTFDTERAAWITYTTTYSPAQIGGPSNYRVGGNTSITSMFDINGPVTFYIYSSETGTYNINLTGILYNAHPYYYNVGLQSAMTLDDWNHGWFHNSKTGISQSKTFQDSNKTNYLMSVDYGSFCRYSNDQSTMMDLWFFNANTNRLSKTTLVKDVTPSYTNSPYSFVFVPGIANNIAVFYSPIHDSIMVVNSSLTYYATRGIFSWLYNSGSTLLFDAANLNLVELNSIPVSSTKSDSLILFKTGYVYNVYDASNRLTTTFDLGGPPGYNIMNGNIVLVASYNYSKYYAFQKTKADWIELLPEGNHLGVSVGNNTALVVRYNKIYAFAPDGLNEVVPENTIPVKSFSLSQNFPNPFNPTSRIQYQVPSISQVVLKIYDILGNEIATLVNEEKPAGVTKLSSTQNLVSII